MSLSFFSTSLPERSHSPLQFHAPHHLHAEHDTQIPIFGSVLFPVLLNCTSTYHTNDSIWGFFRCLKLSVSIKLTGYRILQSLS